MQIKPFKSYDRVYHRYCFLIKFAPPLFFILNGQLSQRKGVGVFGTDARDKNIPVEV